MRYSIDERTGLVDRLDYVFEKTVKRLEQTCASAHEEFDALSAAADLRMLLGDGSSLAPLASQRHHLRLRFSVPSYPVPRPDEYVFWAVGDDFDESAVLSKHRHAIVSGFSFKRAFDPTPQRPIMPEPSIPIFLKIEQFRKKIVILCDGEEISVLDVISTLANVQGGVHLGAADNPRQEALQRISDWFSVTTGISDPPAQAPNIVPATSHTLLAIGRVVVRSLQSVRTAIDAAKT